MTDINKQKFLTELGRLLTFMSAEDRIEALTLYEKMFDDADDEQVLLNALQSPTRQAVVIARAYDAGARRQANEAEGEEEEATPDFVRAILKVYEDSVPLYVEPVPAPAPAPEEAEAEEEEEPEPSAVIEEQVSLFDAPLPAEEETESAEAPEERGEEEKLNDFLADFEFVEERAPVGEAPLEQDPLRAWLQNGKQPEHTAREEISHSQYDDEDEAESRTETNYPLLVLFVLVAVPLTVCGIALLLIPTLLSLVLAAAAIVAGCGGMVAAFGGFAVFADILIVFGCAMAALALGLLFLWLFIWFVGEPIVGLVRWVMRLGSSWCSKEVPA